MKNLSHKNKKLYFSTIELEQINKKFKTPFYLYSQEILESNFLQFSQAAIDARLIDPLVCFALKANSNKELLTILAKLGAGADIVSGGELRRALDAGIPPQKIVFSGVGKTEDEIIYALKASPEGIFSFNVESLEELELINKCAKKTKRIARICFRLNPMVQAKTHKFISTGHKTHKFGLLEEDILSTLHQKKYFRYSKLVGLSIHIGSQLLELSATKKAIKKMAVLALKTKLDFEFLDVGGGLGVDYHPDQKDITPSIRDYMEVVHSTLETFYYSKTCFRPRVVFEPGRKIIANAGIFVMKVIRNKRSGDKHFVIVDGGMNDFVRPSLYGAYHELLLTHKNVKNVRPTYVVGPICETSDCFAEKRLLPELKTGDLIALMDTGAYGYTMGSNYNLRGRPLELLITKKSKVKVINKAQNYLDIL